MTVRRIHDIRRELVPARNFKAKRERALMVPERVPERGSLQLQRRFETGNRTVNFLRYSTVVLRFCCRTHRCHSHDVKQERQQRQRSKEICAKTSDKCRTKSWVSDNEWIMTYKMLLNFESRFPYTRQAQSWRYCMHILYHTVVSMYCMTTNKKRNHLCYHTHTFFKVLQYNRHFRMATGGMVRLSSSYDPFEGWYSMWCAVESHPLCRRSCHLQSLSHLFFLLHRLKLWFIKSLLLGFWTFVIKVLDLYEYGTQHPQHNGLSRERLKVISEVPSHRYPVFDFNIFFSLQTSTANITSGVAMVTSHTVRSNARLL